MTNDRATRIPSLDGWRGIAISLVMFDHIQYSLLHRHYARPWTETGYHGVTVFFVISGFLITSKLLEGRMDFKRFYLRRFFRLMPVAWVFLGALVALRMSLNPTSGRHAISLSGLAGCLFFYRNFIGINGFDGHFWSLSVEEQFYLVWPFILFFAGRRTSRWIALSGAIGCSAFRWIFWAHYSHTFPTGPTFLHADGLLVGCLLALLFTHQQVRAKIEQWSRFWVLPALFLTLFCFYIQRQEWLLCEQVSIASLIAATTLHPNSVFARMLSFSPLRWLGIVSYSVYVWQGFFVVFGNAISLCILMPLTILCSYYCIERPFARYGHRITRASYDRNLAEDGAVVLSER